MLNTTSRRVLVVLVGVLISLPAADLSADRRQSGGSVRQSGNANANAPQH